MAIGGVLATAIGGTTSCVSTGAVVADATGGVTDALDGGAVATTGGPPEPRVMINAPPISSSTTAIAIGASGRFAGATTAG